MENEQLIEKEITKLIQKLFEKEQNKSIQKLLRV